MIVVKTARQIIEEKKAKAEAKAKADQQPLSVRKDVRAPSHSCPDIEIMPVRRFHTDQSLTTLMLCGCRHSVYAEDGWRDGYVSFCLAHGQMTAQVHQFIREFCVFTTEQWVNTHGLRSEHEAT
jgi:hypothetical protein